MCMHGQVTMLCPWKYHNLGNQLYSHISPLKNKGKSREEVMVSEMLRVQDLSNGGVLRDVDDDDNNFS